MTRRLLDRLSAHVAARAVDAGVVRGSCDYRRFVVLGWYRTGSNLLLSLLNSDPTVVAYSELFSPRGLFWGNHAYRPRDAGARWETLRTEDAAGFLREAVFRRYPARVRAVGFKLFYPQLVIKPVDGLAETLAADEDLHVVHLRRRNLLRVLVSNEVARRSGQMSATSAQEARAALERVGSLHLTPRRCESYFRHVERRAAECAEIFAKASCLDVDYEDLADRRDAEIARVRAFLGLPPATATTPLVRQAGRPLSELVENLDELRAHFRGTPREEWFEA